MSGIDNSAAGHHTPGSFLDIIPIVAYIPVVATKSKTRTLSSLCRLLESSGIESEALRRDFGNALYVTRFITRGLSVAELAVILGVERSTIYRWESGERFPDAEMLATIRAWAEGK